jgi:hypothetical protein
MKFILIPSNNTLGRIAGLVLLCVFGCKKTWNPCRLRIRLMAQCCHQSVARPPVPQLVGWLCADVS